MAEILGLETGLQVPQLGLTSGYWTGTIIVLFILASLGVAAWYFYQKSIYRFNIQYYENLGGNRFLEAGKDKARLIRLGITDGELLYAKRKRLWLPADGLRMGLNKYYFAKNNEDGYWYNITLGDLDAKAGILDIEPTDRDMKATAYAIRKNTEGRLAKKNDISKLLQIAVPVIMLLILVIGGGYLINKVGDAADRVATNTNKNIEIQAQIAEANKQVVTKLDQILADSGIRQSSG